MPLKHKARKVAKTTENKLEKLQKVAIIEIEKLKMQYVVLISPGSNNAKKGK